MATRPTRPKGYLTKGKTKSPDAARKAAARQQLTSPRKLAGLVINSVLDGTPAGRGAKAAKASSKVMLAVRREMRKKAAGVGQRKTVSSVAARKAAEQAKFAPAGIQRGGKAKGGTRPLRVETGRTASGNAKAVTKGKTPTRSPGQGAAQLTSRPGKTDTKTITKSYQDVRRTPRDVIRERAEARNKRVRTALTPLKPRGTKSGGKTMQTAKTNPQTVTTVKNSPAKERAKRVNPDDRKLDASRREGMRNAAESRKTPEQREREFRTEPRRPLPSRPDKQMIESDRRVAQGLREIRKAERVKRKANQ